MIKYINPIQLKVARYTLKLGVRDIAKILKVSKSTISKTELGKTRDFLYKHSAALIEYFKKNNIIFPNEYSIRYNFQDNSLEKLEHIDLKMTSFQAKGARYILNINQAELAKLLNVNKNLITNIEVLEKTTCIDSQNPLLAINLKSYFLQHGIEFPDPMSIFFKKYVDNTLNK